MKPSLGQNRYEHSTAGPDRCGSPSPEWWARLVESYLPPVYRYVRVRVPPGAADDVVQETFFAVAQALTRFDPARGSFWQWLRSIAHRKVADHYRREALTPPEGKAMTSLGAHVRVLESALVSGEPTPDELAARAEVKLLVRTALSTLEPRYRSCLVARYVHGMSLGDLSQLLEMSPSAANSLLHRARCQLRDVLLRMIGQSEDGEVLLP